MSHLREVFKKFQKNAYNSALRDVFVREKKLKALQEEIKSRRNEIAEAVYADFKKHKLETELTEIHTTLAELKYTLKNLYKWTKPKRVCTPLTLFHARSYLYYEPKGVVLIMAPWNYPFTLLMNGLISAIAAGNLVILRPSEKAPQTSKIIEKIVQSVFLENEVYVALGDLAVSIELLEFPFDHIFYTGSTKVGKIVMEKAAANLTSITLELGGKSPVVISEDYDLSDAASKIAWGKLINAGQTCVAPDYVFVPNHKKDQFLIEMKNCIERTYGKNESERKDSRSFARIIDRAGFDRLNSLCHEDENIFQDQRSVGELYFPPTVVDLKKDYNHKVMDDEIFGPVLPVLTYDSLDEVITFIQNRPKPLALYLFTNSKKIFEKVLLNTTSGGMVQNHVLLHLGNKELPFGGVGHSGMGSYHGHFGFKTFSHERALLRQGAITLSKFYFPPYHLQWKKWMFQILRWFE